MANLVKDLKAAQAALTDGVTSKKIALEPDVIKVIMDPAIVTKLPDLEKKLDASKIQEAAEKPYIEIVNLVNAYGDKVEKKAAASKHWTNSAFKKLIKSYTAALEGIIKSAKKECDKKAKLPMKIDVAMTKSDVWKKFGDHCKKEHNGNEWEFMDKCKSGLKPSDLQGLYDTYISTAASKQVNIDTPMANAVRDELAKPKPDMKPFKAVYDHVTYTLQDSYTRFLKSATSA